MVKRSVRLKVVLDLASRKEKEALDALSKAQQSLKDEVARYQQLESYMRDYQNKIRGEGQTQLSVAQYANYQGFLHQLGGALEQQQKRIDAFKHQVELCTQHWRVAHEKTRGMEEHIERCKQGEDYDQAKQEQKMLDEFSQVQSSFRQD